MAIHSRSLKNSLFSFPQQLDAFFMEVYHPLAVESTKEHDRGQEEAHGRRAEQQEEDGRERVRVSAQPSHRLPRDLQRVHRWQTRPASSAPRRRHLSRLLPPALFCALLRFAATSQTHPRPRHRHAGQIRDAIPVAVAQRARPMRCIATRIRAQRVGSWG
jgi:hypothetical protein